MKKHIEYQSGIVKREKKWLKVLKEISKHISEDERTVNNVTQHACYADAGLRFKTNLMDTVFRLMVTYKPIDLLYCVDGSCSTFRPEATMKKKDRKEYDSIRSVPPVTMEMDYRNSYERTASVTWFAKLEKFTIEVEVELDFMREELDCIGFAREEDVERKNQYGTKYYEKVVKFQTPMTFCTVIGRNQTSSDYYGRWELYWDKQSSIDAVMSDLEALRSNCLKAVRKTYGIG